MEDAKTSSQEVIRWLARLRLPRRCGHRMSRVPELEQARLRQEELDRYSATPAVLLSRMLCKEGIAFLKQHGRPGARRGRTAEEPGLRRLTANAVKMPRRKSCILLEVRHLKTCQRLWMNFSSVPFT